MVAESGLPQANEVVKVLFRHLCECCELGEKGCIQPHRVRCPAFDAVMAVCPDNPFVLRVMGRLIRCPKCGRAGMGPPITPFNALIQPFLLCLSCGAPFWRDAYGTMVDDPLLAGKEPEIVEIGDELKLRIACHRPPEESITEEAGDIIRRGHEGGNGS